MRASAGNYHPTPEILSNTIFFCVRQFFPKCRKIFLHPQVSVEICLLLLIIVAMIVVIDYCVGNVRSVCNALDKIDCANKLSNSPEEIAAADGLILPGVAAFGYAMGALGASAEAVVDFAKAGKPLLGICVGYQVLFESSSELGTHKGLSLIGGSVEPLPKTLAVPHMGWNSVCISKDNPLFAGFGEQEYFYFAHSFCANINDDKAQAIYTEYGNNVVAAVKKDNIYGVQFHPEKSGEAGLKLLKNFEKICSEGNLVPRELPIFTKSVCIIAL